MTSERAYCDHNATSPIRPEVKDAITSAWSQGYGNPSSVHKEGRSAQAALRSVRKNLSQLLDCHEDEIIFVSGGSEANATILDTYKSQSIWATEGEHDSIRNHPYVKTGIRLQPDGRICLASLQNIVSAERPKLVSCHGANNETGVVQPLREVRTITEANEVLLHADLSQYCGRKLFSFRDSGLDYATITSHKIGGPVGIAAIISRRGRPLSQVIHGGHQELGRRAGTESIALAYGFARAMELAIESRKFWVQLSQQVRELEDDLNQTGPVIVSVGKDSPRLENTLAWLTPGYRSETLIIIFDQAGIALSAGSACGSGSHDPPHTLLAMGYSSELARSALRVSFGWNTKSTDFKRIVDVWRSLPNKT